MDKELRQKTLEGEALDILPLAKEMTDTDEPSPSGITGGVVSRINKVSGPPFHIKSIKVRNLKSIFELEVDFTRISILTGPNNSGKSTILQSISLAFECFARNVIERYQIKDTGSIAQETASISVNVPKNLWHNNVWQKAGKNIPIEISVTFTNGEYFIASMNHYFGMIRFKITDYSKGLRDPKNVEKLINSFPFLIPGIPGLVRHEQPILPSILSSAIEFGQHPQVIRNVLVQIKSLYPDRYKILEEAINQHFGMEIGEIDFDITRSLEIKVPYKQGGNSYEIISGGSGFHQILQLISLLIYSSSSIVLLDEPDSHLHTSLQKKLYIFLDDLSKKLDLQIIISTHSRDFLASSPLSSIIPVDISQRKLKPMAIIDHLLSEYKRQGEISNLELACLYNSKSCLFVEGVTDIEILLILAEKFKANIFNGPRHIIVFPYKGKDRLGVIPDVINLFKDMVGSEIKWFVIRDSDGLTNQSIKLLKEKMKALTIVNYHVWNKYEIENYLCNPRPIVRLLSNEDVKVTEDEIALILAESAEKVFKENHANIITSNQSIARYLSIPYSSAEEARDLMKNIIEDIEMKRQSGVIGITPGKDILGNLCQIIQTRYGKNIRIVDIAREIKIEELDKELLEVYSKITTVLSNP